MLAPLLYAAAQAAEAQGWPLGQLSNAPFSRYVSRSLMIVALLGLWPLMRFLEVRSWRDLGWVRGRADGRDFGWGFGLGLATLALAFVLVVTGGGRVLDGGRTWFDLGRHLVNAVLAAVFVSVLEETLFRGAIFGSLRRSLPWFWALAGSSLVYALVHFLGRPPTPPEVRWYSGFLCLGAMAEGFVQPAALMPGLLNLWMTGMILGLAFQRTGALWWSVGLHAGWVFWVKTYGFVTADVAGANVWWWGTRRFTDGWLALGILGAVWAGVTWWLAPRAAGREAGEAGSGASRGGGWWA